MNVPQVKNVLRTYKHFFAGNFTKKRSDTELEKTRPKGISLGSEIVSTHESSSHHSDY